MDECERDMVCACYTSLTLILFSHSSFSLFLFSRTVQHLTSPRDSGLDTHHLLDMTLGLGLRLRLGSDWHILLVPTSYTIPLSYSSLSLFLSSRTVQHSASGLGLGYAHLYGTRTRTRTRTGIAIRYISSSYLFIYLPVYVFGSLMYRSLFSFYLSLVYPFPAGTSLPHVVSERSVYYYLP
ncbi:hypothetical protein K466DRAFT_98878 [Polyporus arcularius HHB13444]|uniref:Uncharacterized protein n=1 Tax=Polyporus arcularius HHB13444 TaxID=1314778 RepID=A0A5C3PFH2_9APHY|nr:hypothetical protein K466DRAFT_98878 [Polyporus arcularius HHB13444]